MIYVNNLLVEFGKYPNNESIVPDIVTTAGLPVVVRLHFTEDADLTRLWLVHGLLTQRGFDPTLLIDYMPYSRMDRSENGSCFSLEHIATMIDNMGWDSIVVIEPHSDVTSDLLTCEVVNSTMMLAPKAMEYLQFDKDCDLLVLPDKGAFDRYYEQNSKFFDGLNFTVLDKDRDFDTGKILGLKVHEDYLIAPMQSSSAQALIIDDLCSRGGTFIGAAQLLKKHKINNTSLLVTHMEQAGLEGQLRNELHRVFCTDTMEHTGPYPNNFTIFHRQDWLSL